MTEALYTYLKKQGYFNYTLVEILSDASDRTYYRFVSQNDSIILMKRQNFSFKKDRFCKTHEFFKKINIRVPEIYNYDEEKGYIILEDLGDKNITKNNFKNKDLLNTLILSVELILKYQDNKINNLYPMTYSFTYTKFYNELMLAKYYYLNKYKKKNFYKETELKVFFKELVEKMMQKKFLLNHRDYHSRNILFFNKKLCLIDFQDARLGPYAYDLASLIIDPYLDIDLETANILMAHYYNKTQFEAYDEFLKTYYLCFIQRAFKILGTYAYMHIKKNKHSYLTYIPIVLDKVKKIKKLIPEYETLIEEVLLS